MEPLNCPASAVQVSKEILILCAKYALAVKDAKKDIERLSNEVMTLHDVLNGVKDLAESQNAGQLPALRALTTAIDQCSSELEDLKTRLDPDRKRRVMARFGIRALKWPFKSEEVSNFIKACERYKTTINLALGADQSRLIVRVGGGVEQLAQDFSKAREDTKAEFESSKVDQHLSKLPCADGAAFNSRIREHESQCLPETRVDLLQQIMTWSKDPSSACIFWLNGIAGAGKSTIARTVAHTWAEPKRLGASFFFSKGRGDLGHATKFFTTLAAQLANTLPAVKPYICRAIQENPDIAQRGLGDQWKHLIFQPLSVLKQMPAQTQVLILVIDALDECEGEDDVRLILRLLAQAKNLDTVWLRVFITSRPETPIRFGFHTMPDAAHEDFVLHNISPSIIQHDISIFLHHELRKVREEHNVPEEWPGEERIELLNQRASGLFIYASTACRFIQDPLWSPDESLSLILKDAYVGQSPTRELDEMYTRILTNSIARGDLQRGQQKLSDQFKRIVGSIVILFDTLPVTMLARLLGMQVETVHMRLRCLHSVLDIPDSEEFPVRLLHPSFRDFLLGQERCLDTRFWIDEKSAHGDLFESCLKLMSEALRRDVCNLRLPGALASKVERGVVESCLPLDVQYACRNWVYHLWRSKVKLCDNDQVHTFLQKHFLHWLEALSIIGKISDAVLIVGSLEVNLRKPESNANHHLLAMVSDARRFVLDNRSIIETAPLQVYCSALVFSPRMSEIRSQFWDQAPHWIKTMPAVQKNWTPQLQLLEGHSGTTTGLAFSPDGELLASASDDKSVRLWDPKTGASRGILEGHSNYVNSVAFSPDGQLLASASDDKTVRLWDPKIGVVQSTLQDHSREVTSVAFSPDGQLLASASNDKTVKLWDPKTGVVQSTLHHSNWITSVAFSLDGQLLASASADNTIRLWDPKTGVVQSTLQGHSNLITAVAFSPDGQLLASASADQTVRLWDPKTGVVQSTLQDHSCQVMSVAFSPDGQLLALASADHTVRLWDLKTGVVQSTLQGHSNNVTSVAFSPNGQLLASASEDKTVRLWDPKTEVVQSTLQGHSDYVRSVAFSSNGQLLASASSDKTVRLWDPKTEVVQSTLQDYSNYVMSVAFSPNGQLLASASDDKTVRLWDPKTGVVQSTLQGHSHEVTSVAFSPDGQLLASASYDDTVRLWDPKTGVVQSTLQGHSDYVRSVAFSPDGQLLASASNDKTVRLWDPKTGVIQSILRGHSDIIRSVAFSPNGQLLASASNDKTVRLWDPKTGVIQSTLRGHSDFIRSVAFSLNGQLLASVSSDNIAMLWDPSTGALCDTLEGYSCAANAVAFAPGGQFLASASGDKAVKLRDLSTGASCGTPEGHSNEVNSAALSPDGQLLVSTSSDKAIRPSDIETKETTQHLSTEERIQQLPYNISYSDLSHYDSSRSLSIRWNWVTWGTENIIWLPPDYRGECQISRHNFLAIGCNSGGVTFIEFDPDAIPCSTTNISRFSRDE